VLDSRSNLQIVGFCLISVIVLLFLFSSAYGSQLEVCNFGCDYSSINTAIDNALPHDVIVIEAGVYDENLLIDKDLTLAGAVGEKVVVTTSNKGEPLIAIGPSDVRVEIRNLTISGSSGPPADTDSNFFPDGILVKGQGKLELLNVIISSNSGSGIRLLNETEVNIVNSSLAHNGNAGYLSGMSKLFVENSRISGNGLVLWGDTVASISDSTLSNHNNISLELRDSSKLSVINSKIGTCETCILLTDNSFMDLDRSSVEDAGDGIRLLKTSNVAVSKSELSGCTSGIDIRGNAVASIIDTKITSNDHGISLFDMASLEVRNCRVAVNDIGIRANPGSAVNVTGCGVRFYNNSENDTAGIVGSITESLQDRCKS